MFLFVRLSGLRLCGLPLRLRLLGLLWRISILRLLFSFYDDADDDIWVLLCCLRWASLLFRFPDDFLAPPPWVLMRCGFLRGLVCPFIKESGETFVVVDLNRILCNQKLMFLLVLCARSVVLLLFLRGFLWVLRFADVAMSFSFYDDADGDDSWSTVALVVYAWDFSLEIWIL